MAEQGRIVVALDTASVVLPVIETAAGLAASLDATLDALFVEDEQLLRLAALPFAHELEFPSARVRRIEPAEIERALRAQVEQARRLLAATAAPLAVSWHLSVVRGDVMRTVCGYAAPSDLLVVGRSLASYPSAGAGQLAAERFASLRGRPVLALFDGTSAAGKALLAAQGLARVAGAPLVVLIPAAGPEPFRRLREQAAGAAAAGAGPAPASYVMLPDLHAGTVARVARAQSAGALVWPGSGGRDPAAIAAIVEAAPCPVVLAG
jgi:predicted phosphoribosyltransferase